MDTHNLNALGFNKAQSENNSLRVELANSVSNLTATNATLYQTQLENQSLKIDFADAVSKLTEADTELERMQQENEDLRRKLREAVASGESGYMSVVSE